MSLPVKATAHPVLEPSCALKQLLQEINIEVLRLQNVTWLLAHVLPLGQRTTNAR
jgi:hypothetical protein